MHQLFNGSVLRGDDGAVVRVPGAEVHPERDKDDGLRGKDGVVASVVERDAKTMRIVLDVANADDPAAPQKKAKGWTAKQMHTWFDIDRERLAFFKLTDDELEAIGAAVVSRLAAVTKGKTVKLSGAKKPKSS